MIPWKCYMHLPLSQVDASDCTRCKLQALVYDILPSTTAILSYAIRSSKLSANEQFFVGAQTVQTTQIKQGVSFIATNNSNKTRSVIYSCQQSLHQTNKTTIVWIKTELFFFYPGWMHVYICALALGCFYSYISTWTFRTALITSLDNCMGIKSAP